MPHVVILYSGNLEQEADVALLCRRIADAMLTVTDEQGAAVFPPGGIRVLAYPAAHAAIADGGEAGRAAGGNGDYGFMYVNLRMGRGRSDEVKRRAGEAITSAAKACMSPAMERMPMGLTVQVDEGQEVFDSKTSTLHPLFSKARG